MTCAPLRLLLPHVDATRAVGEAMGRQLQAGDILALSGPLGAGKTALVQGLGLGLCVPQEVAVCSPTFTLINEYPGRLTLYHADLYRLERRSELAELGLWELAGAGGVLAVEWLERFPDAVPGDRLLAELSMEDPMGPRRLLLTAKGPRAEARLAGLGAALSGLSYSLEDRI